MPKLWYGVVWLLAVAVWVPTVSAADERFKVEVQVDVTDVDASTAREKAMSEANRAAFVEVCKRITTVDGAAKLAGMTDAQLINFIKEVSVEDEKTSSVRYIATLQVVLNEDMLRQYMQERQIPVLVQSSRILVIPVFRENTAAVPLLWESSNLWRLAWEKAPRTAGVTFVPLRAAGVNYAVIDAEKALALDGAALDKLMRVNGADEVYVLDAVADGADRLSITATSYSGDKRTVRAVKTPGSADSLFDIGVVEVEKQLTQKIRQQSLTEGSQEKAAVLMFNFDNLRQWVEAEAVLRSIPYVKDIEIQAMGTNKAQFKLVFLGSHDKLLYALRAKSFNLIDNGKFFLLEKV